MPVDDPRLSEATEGQLRARLDELNTMDSYDRMMGALLQAQREAEQAEWKDVKQLQKDLSDLGDRARRIAAINKACRCCDKGAGFPCFPDGDIHVLRASHVTSQQIEKKARELRPDLFEKADKYQRMVEQGRRGPRSRHAR